ncbi:sirohydrochlorin chelatase [Demetria terragena]|uniref:sirohydrochlorin chelatase n=1 Tax=Demetria terragena TaxID=63959 RepID=UPI0003675F3F|nr:CbiX/SirB N-terminal domain-containing protein [Demetria terragena]
MSSAAPERRPLVVLAHGTDNAAGRTVLEQVTVAAANTLGLTPRLGYVDVCHPTAAETMGGLSAPVVVPLFLASGYHVRTDIPEAVAAVLGAISTAPVGSGAAIADALRDRVLAADPEPDAVILTGAGSSHDAARAEVASAAELLSERLGVPVRHAFLSASPPTMAEAYTGLSGRVVVASHLLAPGYFQSKLESTAAALGLRATGPLGSHPAVAAVVVERYRTAVAAGAGRMDT